MGDNNIKATTIKIGLLVNESNQFGNGIKPIIQDVRSDDRIRESFPTSLKIAGKQGFNNKIPRTLHDSLTEWLDMIATI